MEQLCWETLCDLDAYNQDAVRGRPMGLLTDAVVSQVSNKLLDEKIM